MPKSTVNIYIRLLQYRSSGFAIIQEFRKFAAWKSR